MGICKTLGGMKCEGYDRDILILLNIAADIAPLLQEESLHVRHGIVVFTEKRTCYEGLLDHLQAAGAVVCKNLTAKSRKIRNNQIALHFYGRYDKAAELADFLENVDFTPVIATYGVLPDCLKEENLLVFTDEEFGDALSQLEQCKCSMHKHPDIVQRELRRFKTSNVYSDITDKFSPFTTLEASAHVFCNFYRESHTEDETKLRYEQLRIAIIRAQELSESNSGEFEVAEAVKKAIETYLERDDEVVICSVNNVDSTVQTAMKANKALLYDDEWYYISEKLLSNSCAGIRRTVSMPQIKDELWKKGLLWCNNTAQRNYTIKKQVVTSYGYPLRRHFLKIRREFFASAESLGLEERRREPCTSETLVEVLVKSV